MPSRFNALLLAVVMVLLPSGAWAQSGEEERENETIEIPADSAGAHDVAKYQQTRFESYRESRLPPSYNNEVAMCDELDSLSLLEAG